MITTRTICAVFALLAFFTPVIAGDETFVVQRVGVRITVQHPFVKNNWEDGLPGFSNALYYTITKGDPMGNFNTGLYLRDSLPDGSYNVYLDSSFSRLLLQAQYKNGNRTGEWVYYYPNKKPAYRINYLNNERNGAATTYDYKGNVLSRGTYVHDKLNGSYTYTDAATKVKCIYKNDSLDGLIGVEHSLYDVKVKQTAVYKQGALIDSVQGVVEGGNNFNSAALMDAMDPVYTNRTLALTYESDAQFVKQLSVLEKRSDIQQLHITLGSLNTARKVDSLLQVFLPALKAQTALHQVWISGGRRNSFPAALYQLTGISTIWYYAGARHYYPNEPEEDDTIHLPFDRRIANLVHLKTVDIERDFTPNQMQQMVQLLSQCAGLRSIHFGDYYDFNEMPGNLHLLNGVKEITGLHIGVADSAALTKLYKLTALEHLDVEPYSDEERWYDSLFVHLPLCQITVFHTCFPAGTLVAMADGSQKAIEELQVGEQVLAFDTSTLQATTATITKLFNSGSEQKSLLKIIFGSQQQLSCTFNHPLFVLGKGYIAAELLQKGDWVIVLGETIRFEQVLAVETLTARSKVYNIETTLHNYFAGHMLVHNK